MKYLFLVSLLILSLSCKKEERIITPEKTTSNTENSKNNNFSFLDNYKFENVPVKDSTNFDNYYPQKKLSEEQINLLDLNKIFIARKLTEFNNVSVRYRLNLSKDFHTIIVSFQNGEHELFTVLANYSDHYSLIDWEYISYDEIAESQTRIESEISQNQITVIETNYYSEFPETKTEYYKILKSGEIE